MDKNIVFLSGLPRTGSTLLTSILSQNPDIYVDGSSPLARILFGVSRTCNFFASEGLIRIGREDFTEELLTTIPEMFYKNVNHKYIVEKDRAWGRDELDLIKYVSEKPRVLMMIRPITDIVRSFVHVKRINGDLLPEKDLLIAGVDPFMDAIQNTAYALQNVSDKFLFGTYDQLVTEPDYFMNKVYDFWGIPSFSHSYTKIKNPKPENDRAFRTEGLHDVRPNLKKRVYETKVSKHLWKFAKELDVALWEDVEKAKAIRPESFI